MMTAHTIGNSQQAQHQHISSTYIFNYWHTMDWSSIKTCQSIHWTACLSFSTFTKIVNVQIVFTRQDRQESLPKESVFTANDPKWYLPTKDSTRVCVPKLSSPEALPLADKSNSLKPGCVPTRLFHNSQPSAPTHAHTHVQRYTHTHTHTHIHTLPKLGIWIHPKKMMGT